MLFCLLHTLCGLPLAAAPAFPQTGLAAGPLEHDAFPAHAARIEKELFELRAQALDDGTVALAVAPRRPARFGWADPAFFLVRPDVPQRLRAELREHRGRLLMIWRNVEFATGTVAGGVAAIMLVNVEGGRLILEQTAAKDPIGAGEHPGVIVCPAEGLGFEAQAKDGDFGAKGLDRRTNGGPSRR